MCNCLKAENARLNKYYSAQIRASDGGRPLLAMESLNGRGHKLPAVAAKYCPFCGKKYEEGK